MPSSEYEIIPTDPIEKLAEEIENLKDDLATLKNELKNNIEEIKKQISVPSEENPAVKKEAQAQLYYAQSNIDTSFYKEIVNSLIKSNIDLQAKISELIVVTNNLYKEIKNLFDIFKEAALLRPKEKETYDNNIELLKRIENLEKANLKVAELLDNLKKQIESIKSNQSPSYLGSSIQSYNKRI
jgi:Zn-dependent M32 family carboxypeptidase